MEHKDLKRLKNHHVDLSDVYDVNPKQLQKHADNDRLFGQFKTEAQLSELGESIRKYGILEPIIVCPDGVTILSGHSRVMLAKLHRLPTIKARRILSDHTPEELLEILVILNLHRMNLSKKDRLGLYMNIYPDFEDRLLMPGAKFCTGRRGEIGLNAKVVASALNLPEQLVKADLHEIKAAARMRKRSSAEWDAARIRGVNRNATIAVQGYCKKINEWISTSNPQTKDAIMEIVADAHRRMKRSVKETV